MMIWTCWPCEQGNHESCFGVKSPPPGMFGGSKCVCSCRNEKQPEINLSELMTTPNLIPFSNEVPKEEGAYWWKQYEEDNPQIRVFKSGDLLLLPEYQYKLWGLWSCKLIPITVLEDAQKKIGELEVKLSHPTIHTDYYSWLDSLNERDKNFLLKYCKDFGSLNAVAMFVWSRARETAKL